MRRRDVDIVGASLVIAETRTAMMDGTVVTKAPKTEAGKRTLAVPSNIFPLLKAHLDAHVDPDMNALVLPDADPALRHA